MSDAPAAEALVAGTGLHGYRIESLLATQRFGFSYLVRDGAGRSLVLRELLPHEHAVREDAGVRARDPEDRAALRFWVRSFINLGAALGRLAHAGIARTFAQFEANGTAYHVTEHAGTQTLADRLAQAGILDQAKLQRILVPVLEGLELAHAAGLVHRDISPQHIVLRPDGSGCLTDFSALRAPLRLKSRTLFSAADPAYAAPEDLAAAGKVGTWTDVYTLAAVAYQCISRKPPPAAQQRLAGTALRPLSQAAVAACTAGFAAAIDAALALDAAARPAGAAGLLALLLDDAAPSPSPDDAPRLAVAPEQAAESAQERPAAMDEPAAWAAPEQTAPGPALARKLPLAIYALAAVVVLGAAAGGYLLLRPRSVPTEQAAPAAAGPPPAEAPAPAVAAAPLPPPVAAAVPALPAAAPAAPAATGGTNVSQAAAAPRRPAAPPGGAPSRPGAETVPAAAPNVPGLALPPSPSAAPPVPASPVAEVLVQTSTAAPPAAAPPPAKVATPPEPATAAPAPNPEAEFKDWYRNALAMVHQRLVYPPDAQRDGEQGDVTMSVTLLRDGTVVAAKITSASDFDALNAEAQKAFGRLHKFPPLPAGYRADAAEIDVSMPISFKIAE